MIARQTGKRGLRFTGMVLGCCWFAGVSHGQLIRAEDISRRMERAGLAEATAGPAAPRVEKTEAEWREQLTESQFRIVRRKGTERAWSGAYHASKEPGRYRCIACDAPLFHSQAKYDSQTGWPSYWAPISRHQVAVRPDRSLFMVRTEVICASCDAHLGHVFDDGPQPTGLRYCINSDALRFEPAAAESPEQPGDDSTAAED